jgi:outer membrane lipoprotein SlyB
MHKFVILSAVVGLVTAGCTFPSSRRTVSARTTGHLQHVEYGVIERVDGVVVSGQRTQLGTLGGGVVGAAAASDVGHGAGRHLARAGGAVAGAIVGQAVEEAVTRKEGQEMIIKLDSGKSVVITQTSPPGFRMGERVAVVSGGGGPARVTYP